MASSHAAWRRWSASRSTALPWRSVTKGWWRQSGHSVAWAPRRRVPRTISRSGAEGGLGDLRDAAVGVDAGIPQTPEMASLSRRIPPTRQHDGHHCVTVFDHLCVACHGFSVLLTGQVGNRRRSVLFDVGPYGDVWVDNAARLGIDISLIDTIFLSHWHWDHSGGLPVALAAISDARREAGLGAPVVDVHPDRPDQRGVMTPSGVMAMLPRSPPSTPCTRPAVRSKATRRHTCSPAGCSSPAAPSHGARATRPDSKATTRSAARAGRLTRRSWMSASLPRRCVAVVSRCCRPARTPASSTPASLPATTTRHARRPGARRLPSRRWGDGATHRCHHQGPRRARRTTHRRARTLHRLAREGRPRRPLRPRPLCTQPRGHPLRPPSAEAGNLKVMHVAAIAVLVGIIVAPGDL